MATMTEIEAKAKVFSEARASLTAVCGVFKRDLEAVKAKHLQYLKASVAIAVSKHAELTAAIKESPDLFVKPRSVVLNGVKLGFQKGKGKMTIEDEDKTVALIEKHFPDQAEVLISIVKKPAKSALELLSAADLKKVGVVVSGTGDVVFAKDTAAEVDKLVAAFLKDDVDQDAEEQRAAA